jgi:aryl-alcohol dehydrogenase-like predicted oxidoreductase
LRSIEASLKRLKTDYVDIYLCHEFDSETPLTETIQTLHELILRGDIRYWGTSNWTGAQIRLATRLCEKNHWSKPILEQTQYNLLERYRFEYDTLPAARECGMGLVAWSPLASGILTGKYDAGFPQETRLGTLDWVRELVYRDEYRERVLQFKKLSDDMGCSRSQLALSWLLENNKVSSTLIGVTSIDQLKENLLSLRLGTSPEVLSQIDEMFEHEI